MTRATNRRTELSEPREEVSVLSCCSEPTSRRLRAHAGAIDAIASALKIATEMFLGGLHSLAGTERIQVLIESWKKTHAAIANVS
jgi:hypothetical protein